MFQHHTLPTNNIQLHVVTAGPEDGPPVMLLHGFPEFWGGWRKQMPALAEAGYRVLAPDQRGYNLSSVPREVRAYALDTLARDVVGLMDAFHLPAVNLVGHDWGAAVAWTVGLLYPERVRKLAILNVPHPAVMLRFLRASPAQMLKSWYIGFFQIPGLADWLLKRNNYALAVRLLIGSGQKGTFNRTELEDYKQAYANAGGLTGMINWYRALLWHQPALPRDRNLKMPVRILWGERDVALSAAMATASLAHCPHGTLTFFPNATHWVQHDEPAAVNAALLDFFAP